MRDESLDMACGFCLCIVILGHAICMCPTEINLYAIVDLCCFYMAFFFFKAGVVFKQKSNKEIFNGSIRRLIIPYVAFCIVGTGVLILLDYYNFNPLVESAKKEIVRSFNDIIKMGAPSGNLALWFLPSLFVCRYLTNILSRIGSNILLAIILLFISVLLQVSSQYEWYADIPFYFKNIPIGLMLMLFGYILKKKDRNMKVFAVSTILYVSILIVYPSHLGIMGGRPIKGILFSGMIADMSGCVMILNAFVILSIRGVKNSMGGAFLKHLGQHSMPYYCQHWIVLVIAGHFLQGVNEYLKLVSMLACCMVIMPITYHFMKRYKLTWLVGE